MAASLVEILKAELSGSYAEKKHLEESIDLDFIAQELPKLKRREQLWRGLHLISGVAFMILFCGFVFWQWNFPLTILIQLFVPIVLGLNQSYVNKKKQLVYRLLAATVKEEEDRSLTP
jgi:hypothetical protein